MYDNLKLKNFLEIPYDELEEMNLKALEQADCPDLDKLEAEYRAYLTKEKRLKAVTVCFSNIEGRLHMLDYDKKFFLESADNLTFDGSSVRGYSTLAESDLRLGIDWSSIRWLPSDVFGPGKVILFASVLDRNYKPYPSDFRAQLAHLSKNMYERDGVQARAAAEIEGFLVDGLNAEQQYREEEGFRLISNGGYYHSLPLDPLKIFIDRTAEAERAMGFRNEKDHPEVAPSQFELNFSHSDVLRTADNIQLYKLVSRQVAHNMGMTATFLPKPVVGINGSGMHINFSLNKNGKNIFYNGRGKEGLSDTAWDMISRILNHAPEMCLVLNSSVNAYRRLDPNFEAPNQIKVSPVDRGSMIRIPVGDSRSARIEVRSVAPDANPYLVLYTLLKVGTVGDPLAKDEEKRPRLRFLPNTMDTAVRLFKASDMMSSILGEENKAKYVELKELVAGRSPRELGTLIKKGEVIFHHEVTNQVLWNTF